MRKILIHLVSFVLCVSLFQLSFFAYAETDNNKYSTNENKNMFLSNLIDLVNNYDNDPFCFQGPGSGNKESCRLIVKTKQSALSNDQNAVGKVEGWNHLHILQYNSLSETNAALSYYESLDSIDYVEKDQFLELTDSLISSEGSAVEKPLSWGNNVVHSTYVNQHILSSGMTLSKAVVGVFDTGIISSHEYFVRNSDRVEEEVDIFGSGVSISEMINGEIYHGSHVAGIILNNSIPSVSVKSYKIIINPLQSIIAASVLATQIINAVDDGICAINMSFALNGADSSQYIDEALSYARHVDVPIIVAAGNDEEGNGYDSGRIYPANSPDVITVAAIDPDLERMKKTKNGLVSSCFGECVDLSAPGENINSVFASALIQTGYIEASGTSMAAPFVTAAVGTLKSINPNMSFFEIYNRLTSGAYRPENWETNCGAGILDFSGMLSDYVMPKPMIILNETTATITSNVINAIIHYTTDGSDPTTDSPVYTEPVRTTGIKVIKAIAARGDRLTSPIASYTLQRDESASVRYKGTKSIEFPIGYKIRRIYNGDESIASLTEDGKLHGFKVGETTTTVEFTNNCRFTYHIKVEYAWWQQLIRYFLFGFLWY